MGLKAAIHLAGLSAAAIVVAASTTITATDERESKHKSGLRAKRTTMPQHHYRQDNIIDTAADAAEDDVNYLKRIFRELKIH